MEQGFKIPEDYDKVVYLIEKGVERRQHFVKLLLQAQEERKTGTAGSCNKNEQE